MIVNDRPSPILATALATTLATEGASMPEHIAMTEARLSRLAAPADGQVRLYDTKEPHLMLRWRAHGKPRWYVTVRAEGRSRSFPLGTISTWPEVPVEAARALAREAVVALAKGHDPVVTKQEAQALRREQEAGGRVPFAQALERHLGTLAGRGRSGSHVRELERVVRLAIDAGVVDLAHPSAAATAQGWLDSLEVSAPTRHRYRVHLCAVGKTALKWWPAEVLPRDPFLALTGQGAQLPPPPVFTPQDAVLLASDTALSQPDGLVFAFLLYTGCRFREATWARWERIHLDRATFDVVPPSASERAAGAAVKRDKPRTVALPSELVALLRAWCPPNARGFLFEEAWRIRPHVSNTITFRKHLGALGIPLEGRRIHSLRHTRQTLGIACGEDTLRLRLSMGHAGEDMAAHYGRMAMRWRGMLRDWDGELRLRDPAWHGRLDLESPHPSAVAR
jgi:integrase